jgi:hypothetical protein
MVAKELHAVAALDQRLSLGDEALELDRADFGAVLFLLAAPLRLLIVVELAPPSDGHFFFASRFSQRSVGRGAELPGLDARPSAVTPCASRRQSGTDWTAV